MWKKSRSNSEKKWQLWKKRKLNSEKIWKIRKKSRLNTEMIQKIWKKNKLNSEMIGEIWKKGKLNSEMIWKIWNKVNAYRHSTTVKQNGGIHRNLLLWLPSSQDIVYADWTTLQCLIVNILLDC